MHVESFEVCTVGKMTKIIRCRMVFVSIVAENYKW